MPQMEQCENPDCGHMYCVTCGDGVCPLCGCDPDLLGDESLSKITSQNLHGEMDFGKPIGNEIW